MCKAIHTALDPDHSDVELEEAALVYTLLVIQSKRSDYKPAVHVYDPSLWC